MIRRAEHHTGKPLGARPDKPAEWTFLAAQEARIRQGVELPDWLKALPVGVDKSNKVYAEVNHGRWIANCCFCKGAEMVTPTDPRFLCLSCGNQGGTWVPVEFPSNAASIEAELVKRPKQENRNWRAPETLAYLRKENAERGIK